MPFGCEIWSKPAPFYERCLGAQRNARYPNPHKQSQFYFLRFASGARLELMHRPDLPVRGEAGSAWMDFTHLAIALGSREAADNLTAQFTGDGYYDYLKPDGTWETQTREAYDRGNGATILLYHPERRTVILTRQFRLPTYVNGNASGMMIEACADLLDQDHPEDCIRK